MYPRNAASPERIDIGAVVQISDGAVQTSGCTVRIIPAGGAEGDGAGTTAYSDDGVVLYTPTQAETNYTSFILIAKKTGCIPASKTVVTSANATAGKVTVGTNDDKTGYTASTVSDKTGYSLAGGHGLATEAKQDSILGYVDCLPETWVVPAATGDAMTLTAAYDAAKTPAPTTAEIKTAIEADGSKLDHLWEMTEDDAGVRRLTQNALEQAPSGSGATAEEVWTHADRQLTSDGNIAVADATLTRDLKSITTTVTYCIYTFVMAALKSAVSGTSWLIQKPSGVEHKSGTVTTDVNGNITGADLGDES